MVRTAVILAAGAGSRLAPSGNPEAYSKPLMSLGGQTLLERTIRCCRAAGLARIVVVTGFRRELVEAEVARLDRGDLVAVHNAEWRKANGLSLLACREVVREPFALMMSDHVFEPSILRDVAGLEVEGGTVVLAVDRKIDAIFDLDDATKVRLEGGAIVAISKQLDRYDAIDCGLFACSTAIFDALAEVHGERGDCSLSEGMERIGRARRFLPFDIGARWWQDVDTPEMLGQAVAVLEEQARQASEVQAR